MVQDGDVPADLYRLMFDVAPVGLKLIRLPDADDPDGFRYIAANPASLDALGLDAETVVGHRLVDVFPGVRGTPILDNYHTCARERRTVPFGETSFPGPDGQPRWYRSHLVFLRKGYACAVFQNVTAERAARDQLADANAALERMASLGKLAAGVAHEINNPLQHLMLVLARAKELVELGGDNGGGAEAAALIDDALFAAEVVKDVVGQLRHYVRDRKRVTRSVDVCALIDRAAKLASHELRHNVTFERSYREVPRLRANPGELSQVFLNLIVNAAHALRDVPPPRRLHIGARVNDGKAVIHVEDNGPGMAPEYAARIFEPYVTRAKDGMGLGLSICRELVERNGGTIDVESAPGEGTRFVVRLPLVVGPRDAERESQGPPRRRVLVVDDDPWVGHAIELVLDDFEVAVALDVDRAVEQTREGRFELVICDVALGDATGLDIHAALRGTRHDHRVVFLTGGIVDPEVKAGIEALGLPVWEKPLSRADLRSRVQGRVDELGDG